MDQLSGSQKRGDQGAARVWSAAVRWLDIPGPGTTGIVLAALAVLVVTLAAAPNARRPMPGRPGLGPRLSPTSAAGPNSSFSAMSRGAAG